MHMANNFFLGLFLALFIVKVFVLFALSRPSGLEMSYYYVYGKEEGGRKCLGRCGRKRIGTGVI